MEDECKRWSPTLAGIVLGLIILVTYYVAGRGLGTTGGLTRIIAVIQNWLMPELTAKSTYFASYLLVDGHPLNSYLVYMLVGIVLGSFVAAWTGKDLQIKVLRGSNISAKGRLIYAFFGGALVGFAARLARGCTSGQSLVGGAELSVGSWAFTLCVFAGGFATAYLVRKQWL
jgi:uncharacterized membrane protein YedE/YeeE